MANYSLMTVKKGNITTVDGFIKTFNTIGHNMKALCVSAYAFLTSEDKELSIEFGKRVRDELKMSKATLSNLRTAGYLYSLNDYFEKFAYTNVVLFKKNVDALEEINDATLGMMLREIAQLSNSQLSDDVNECVDYLTELSQKDLKHIIEVYNTPVAEATVEDAEEHMNNDPENATLEETVGTVEEFEEATFYNIIDDDFAEIMNTLTVMINEKSLSKKDLVEYAKTVYNRLSTYAE